MLRSMPTPWERTENNNSSAGTSGLRLAAVVCLLLWGCVGWGQSPPPGEAPAEKHVARAEELANKGDLEAATRELQRAIELDPNSATTRVALGEVLEAQGKSEESIREYRQAIQIQ